MEPFEIMISRVPGADALRRRAGARWTRCSRVCEKWEVNATAIGEVTETGGCACSTATSWSATCRSARWSTSARSTTSSRTSRRLDVPGAARALLGALDAGDTLSALLGSANLASRRWAFEQYDCLVGSRTVRRPEAGRRRRAAAARRRLGAIAVSIDGNGRRVAGDPYRGAVEGDEGCRRPGRSRRRRVSHGARIPARRPGRRPAPHESAPIFLGRGHRLWDDLAGFELTHTVTTEVAESGTIHVNLSR